MTIEQLIKKFPKLQPAPEDSLLWDIVCPRCGRRDYLSVEVTTKCEMDIYGTVDVGDHVYDNDSATSCGKCGHAAKLEAFTFTGLDAMLTEKQPHKIAAT